MSLFKFDNDSDYRGYGGNDIEYCGDNDYSDNFYSDEYCGDNDYSDNFYSDDDWDEDEDEDDDEPDDYVTSGVHSSIKHHGVGLSRKKRRGSGSHCVVSEKERRWCKINCVGGARTFARQIPWDFFRDFVGPSERLAMKHLRMYRETHKQYSVSPPDDDYIIHTKNKRDPRKRGIVGECVICMEEIKAGKEQRRRCTHMFHTSCINDWFSVSPNRDCPLCRTK